MKKLALFFCAFLILFASCNLDKREQEIREKLTALNQKEQELLVKERTLALKEEELLKREQRLDSTSQQDTASVYNPDLVGIWSVKMTNTETTCPGSAVGDTKTEQWDIAYQNSLVIAKALSGDKLVRIYSGAFKEAALELKDERDSSSAQPAAKMTVRLRMTGARTMEGQREIIREGGCKIIYALQLNKQ